MLPSKIVAENFQTIHVEDHAVAQLLEALRYKPEGWGFDSRWCN